MDSSDNFDEYGNFKKINWDTQSTPRFWFNGDPLLTYFGNVYVVVTAEVERFTIAVTKQLITEIKDEKLKEALEVFINEECAHAYQHSCVTNHLKQHKYPLGFIGKCAKFFFKLCLKIMHMTKLTD